MGTSCTKLKNKKQPPAHRPPPPPFPVDPDSGPVIYEPRAVAEVPGEILIRIIEPEESQHSSQRLQDEQQEGGQGSGTDGVEVPPLPSGATISDRSVGSEDLGSAAGSIRSEHEEESKSDVASVRSKSSQRSKSSHRSQNKKLLGLFRTKNPDRDLETKGAKTAAHPSKNKTIDDFAVIKDEKDFPTDGLEKIKVLKRDRLPLDILTRKTKILNTLKSKLANLEILELRDCKLNSFPAEFKSRVIKELNFCDNLITELPEDPFTSLTELEVLNVSQNRLTGLPEALSECSKLRMLLASRNQITALNPDMLISLTKLEVLDVMHNKLEKLTFSLQSIPNVLDLNLSMNNIGRVESIFFDEPGSHLEVLKLSINPLADIDEGVLQLTFLRRLDLRQTHIGNTHPVVVRIKQRNKEGTDTEVSCLINQLVQYTEAKKPEITENTPIATPMPQSPVMETEEPALSLQPSGFAPVVEPLEDEEELIAAQNYVNVEEPEYEFPAEPSPLRNPLKELVLQVSDNLHIILTIATIEKVVKTGMESKERGSAVVDLPLTSNYFMERIAKYPSAINVLAAFKYQIKDHPRRGLVLQPTSEFRSAKKPPRFQSRNLPEYRADGQQTPDSTPKSPRIDISIEKLLSELKRFKDSVMKAVEKEFDVPDFKAYHRDEEKDAKK